MSQKKHSKLGHPFYIFIIGADNYRCRMFDSNRMMHRYNICNKFMQSQIWSKTFTQKVPKLRQSQIRDKTA